MADPEEDEQSSLKQIKEYDRNHLVKRLFQCMVELGLFLSTIDPFAIYKGSTYRRARAARFQIYQSDAVKIEPNHSDKRRRRWRIMFRIIMTYFCTKTYAIVLVQVVLQKTSHQLSPATSPEAARINPQEAATGSEQGALMLWVKLLGNPLISLPGVTIFTYGLFAIALSYAVHYRFNYYATVEPLDSAGFRLWLEPVREFRRIDLSIMRTLEMFNGHIKRSCYCRTGIQRRKYSAQALTENREIQVKVIGWLRSRYWRLRPIIYTLEWYRTYNLIAFYALLFIVLCILVFLIGSLRPLFSFLLSNDTSRELELTRLSIYQLITALETLSILLLAIIPMCLIEIELVLTLCYTQMMLLNNVKHHLKVCLSQLRLRNHCKDQSSKEQGTTICALLEPLIKILHSLDELRSNVRFLTEMVSMNVVVSSTACILILLADQLDGENLADFRYVIIGFHWLWANSILVCCGYLHTRASQLETITWSIMAELRTRESRHDWILFEFQIIEFWRRMIMSKCFTDSRLSVQPFGVAFTYHRALQLNFLAISFAGILKSF